MASSAIKGLAFGAALFGGLQAGATANRAFVLLAAWERLGSVGELHARGKRRRWGTFLSRAWPRRASFHGFRRDRLSPGPHRTERRSRRFPVYAAALLAIVWATVTRALILPAMFVLRDASTDTAQLQQIFLTVSRWSGVNDVLHILTFALNLWALAVVFSGPNMN